MKDEEIADITNKINEIDDVQKAYIIKIQRQIQPLAGIVSLVVRNGTEKGWLFNRRYEYKNDDFLIIKDRGLMSYGNGDLYVYYKDELVFHFDYWFPHTNLYSDQQKRRVFKFIEGDWMRNLVLLYKEESLDRMKNYFSMGVNDE